MFCKNKKQPPVMFYKKSVLKSFVKFTGKCLYRSHFVNKVAGWKLETLLKEKLRRRSFPVNSDRFLRTHFL